MKFVKTRKQAERVFVTPLAGVWIEISTIPADHSGVYVTPLAGVWIEIAPSVL